MNEFNECVHEVFSAAGDIIIKSMMGGYLVYLNGKLIGDICANELFLKRTPTSDRFLPKWQDLGGHDVYLIITGHDGKKVWNL